MAKRETWAKRVELCVESGLSTREFAQELGVNPRTLTYWKWKLRSEAGLTRSGGGGRKRGSPETGPSFVEVALAPRGSASMQGAALEVDVRGVVVRVPGNFDESELLRLVSTLEQRQ